MLRPNSLAPSAPARFVRRCGALAALLAALAVTAHAALAPAPAPLTERLSTAAGGAQSDGDSTQADVTPDGRYVAFISEASNLVPGDTNDVADVFVRDRAAGTTERISIATDGTEGDGRCDFTPAISDNGRFIAFASFADNLVADDTNGVFDIFLRDRKKGTTKRLSVSTAGVQANNFNVTPSISADGKVIAFMSAADNLLATGPGIPGDTNGLFDIYVRDRTAGTTTRVSVDSAGVQANGFSVKPAVSGDGNYVAFRSAATNLVVGDTNGFFDVFVHNRTSGVTERVSLPCAAAEGDGDSEIIGISGDGNCVAFHSVATNMVPSDTNGKQDVFVRDRGAGTTERVSLSTAGVEGNGDSGGSAISRDGRYVTFTSKATNLVAGDTNLRDDIFVRDRMTNATVRASLANDGSEADQNSSLPTVNGDGRYVVFESVATNLTVDDGNIFSDIFVRALPIADLPKLKTKKKLKFGDVAVGAMKTASFRIKNRGTGLLLGNVPAAGGAYTLTKGQGPFSLAPGKGRRVTVEFAPTAAGPAGFNLVITANDPNQLTFKVKLRGNGL